MSTRKAIAIQPVLPLQTSPRFDCELADEALYGMLLELLEEKDGWAYVRTPYRYEAWAHTSGLCMDEKAIANWEKEKKTVVLRSFADVMHEKKVQSYPYLTLPRGALVPISREKNGWCSVALADGSIGFARSSWFGEHKTGFDLSNEAALRQELVAHAMSYLGTQYRWGGKTCQGIDCSGLCSMAYLLSGSMIYRDAAIKDGYDMHKIRYADLKCGDLLFFKGHVAMYLGEDKIIHSSGRVGDDGVVINSLCADAPNSRADLLDKLLYCGSLF